MTSSLRPFAFVLMPFHAEFNDIYHLGIKAACEEEGVLAERVDEQKYSETMLERIYRQIGQADFIIADMTGRNPNVFYEVGYAHARGKICTLVTQSADDIPFDLKHHRHIIYDGSIGVLKSSLRNELQWLKAESEKAKTNSISLTLRSISGFLAKKEWSIDGTLSLSVDLHNNTAKRSPEIEAIYIYTSKKWSFSQGGEECPVIKDADGPKSYRTFVKPPVSRLSPSGWAQFKLKGEKQFWNKWSGKEAKDQYSFSGPLHFEIHTSEGILKYVEDASVEFDEFPF